MPGISFEQFFRSHDFTRDKFLSRFFGIFSEEIVRIWCKCPKSPYEDLGRPTLKRPEEKRGRTLDFTFRSKQDGRIYVGELKCELEFENYRYLALTSPSQLDHHTGEAFRWFLAIAKDPRQYTVTVKGSSISVSGAVLVWGSITSEGRKTVMNTTGLADVLSLEQIITDLLIWDNQDYSKFMERRATWCQELFSLVGRKPT